jgi:hypothetical protein
MKKKIENERKSISPDLKIIKECKIEIEAAEKRLEILRENAP